MRLLGFFLLMAVAKSPKNTLTAAFFVSPGSHYTENDDPQPQVVWALGLRITNCAPSTPSV